MAATSEQGRRILQNEQVLRGNGMIQSSRSNHQRFGGSIHPVTLQLNDDNRI